MNRLSRVILVATLVVGAALFAQTDSADTAQPVKAPLPILTSFSLAAGRLPMAMALSRFT